MPDPGMSFGGPQMIHQQRQGAQDYSYQFLRDIQGVSGQNVLQQDVLSGRQIS